MIQSNPVHQVCNYGSSAVYCASPSPEQIRSGVIPLDSLPASWWNWMWADTNQAVNEAREAVGVFVNELNSVLAAAGICPNCMCLNQLYQAIDKIRTTIGNAACAGAVKSSSCPGEVSISAEGIMTANCVGNASQLATSARTLVGAVNELKQTYDCCISTINGSITSLGNTKASNCHASCDTTYGVGSSAEYGHLKITDTFDTCVGGASEGLAVSQAALYNAFTCITGSSATLGNVAACPEAANPSAGICNLAARSDHAHPYPKHLCTYTGYKVCDVNNWGWYGVPMDTLLPVKCALTNVAVDIPLSEIGTACIYCCYTTGSQSDTTTFVCLGMRFPGLNASCPFKDSVYIPEGQNYIVTPFEACRFCCCTVGRCTSRQTFCVRNNTNCVFAIKGTAQWAYMIGSSWCPQSCCVTRYCNGVFALLLPGCTAVYAAGSTLQGSFSIATCICIEMNYYLVSYINPKKYTGLDINCADDRNKIIGQQPYTSVIFNSEEV